MRDERNNTGDCNSGYCNSGYCNSGDWNSGDCNSGDWNSGDCNSGNRNSGNRNSGDWNSGDCNSGDWNSGDWNSGYFNSGYFNTTTPSTVRVFDVETKRSEWDNCDKPSFIYFSLTEWVPENKMSDKEKEEHKETYGNCGGYLKTLGYKEAFQKSYAEATEEDRKKIFNIPNFDADKFYEISGIDVRKDTELEEKKRALIAKANELLKQAEEL